MAGYCHASTLRRLELETEKVQTGKTQVNPCKVHQESGTEKQTSTRLDNLNGRRRKSHHHTNSNCQIRMKTFDEAFEIWSLWDKYLNRDKRSFMEYFEEEHGIILTEYTSFETLEALCIKFIKQ